MSVSGPVVRSIAVRRALVERGLSPAAVHQLLSHSELVRQVGKGLYGLPGSGTHGAYDSPGSPSCSGGR